MILDINTKYMTKKHHYKVIIDKIDPNQPIYTAFGHVYCHDGHATPYAWQSDGTVWNDKSHEYDLLETPNFEIIHETKPVNYFGKSYTIYPNFNYISTNFDGRIKAHITEPQTSNLEWISNESTSQYIDKIKYNGNWTESLICI